MLHTWQIPFQTLREQFLQTSQKGFHTKFTLTSFPNWACFDRWFQERVDPHLKYEASTRCSQKSAGYIWGDTAAVDRFLVLATAAGSSLPSQFRPTVRLFPHWNELSNLRPSPEVVWTEFLY